MPKGRRTRRGRERRAARGAFMVIFVGSGGHRATRGRRRTVRPAGRRLGSLRRRRHVLQRAAFVDGLVEGAAAVLVVLAAHRGGGAARRAAWRRRCRPAAACRPRRPVACAACCCAAMAFCFSASACCCAAMAFCFSASACCCAVAACCWAVAACCCAAAALASAAELLAEPAAAPTAKAAPRPRKACASGTNGTGAQHGEQRPARLPATWSLFMNRSPCATCPASGGQVRST